MKKFDESLKDRLNNIEKLPSNKVWKGVEKNLFWFNFVRLLKRAIIPLGGIVIVSILILFFSSQQSDSTFGSKPAEQSNSKLLENFEPQNSSIMHDHDNEVHSDIQDLENFLGNDDVTDLDQVVKPELEDTDLVDARAVGMAKVIDNSLINSVLSVNTKFNDLDDEYQASNAASLKWSIINSMDFRDIHFNKVSCYGLSAMTPRSDFIHKEKLKKPLSLSVNLNPEVLMGGVDGKAKMLYGSSGFIEMPLKQYLFQLGLGYTFSEDNGNYLIDWQQYDSIGYYFKVGEFEIDPETGQAIFKTSVENIYDSITYNESGDLKHKYHYLNFHLLAGYRIYSSPRISTYILAGPVYSILLNADEGKVDFNNPLAHNTRIFNDSKVRIKNNSFVSLSLNINYRINSKISLGVAPGARIYNKSIYEGRYLNNRTWSLGLRTGIIFKL